MADIDFDDRFVTAVNSNGRKQRIPATWLDHPVLGDGFRLPPSHPSRQSDGQPTQSETPDDTWTVNALRGYATRAGIDLEGATTKAAILAVLDTHQTPDGDPSSDETPAAGDDKEI